MTSWKEHFNDFDYVQDTNVPTKKRFQNQQRSVNSNFKNRPQTGGNPEINNRPNQHQNQQRNKYDFNNRQPNDYQQNSRVSDFDVIRIQDLVPTNSHVNVIGLVIHKDGPKSIMSKKGTERFLVALTIRDAEESFINLTCWGNEGYINSTAQLIHIGDVVKVYGAQVQNKPMNGMNEKYNPSTTSPYQLNISEIQGGVELYSGVEADDYRRLLHIPTKPNNDFYTIEDININGMALQGEHVNILAAVKRVGKTRGIKTKTGKETKKCEVILFDETCPQFTLDLWNINVDIAQSWIPHQTVIFGADVKIIHSEYKSAMIAVADGKTVFTVDPETPEAYSLHSYAMSEVSFANDSTVNEENVSFMAENNIDLDSITEVYTVEKIKEMAMVQEAPVEYGVMFVILSSFDIDCEFRPITRRVCRKCRRTLKEESNFMCMNTSCMGEGDASLILDNGDSSVDYNIPVSLSDHTGTIDYCSLQPSVAENILGVKAEEAQHMNLDALTDIKWKYLLERVKVKVKIRNSSKEGSSRYSVRVISLSLADPLEIRNSSKEGSSRYSVRVISLSLADPLEVYTHFLK